MGITLQRGSSESPEFLAVEKLGLAEEEKGGRASTVKVDGQLTVQLTKVFICKLCNFH